MIDLGESFECFIAECDAASQVPKDVLESIAKELNFVIDKREKSEKIYNRLKERIRSSHKQNTMNHKEMVSVTHLKNPNTGLFFLATPDLLKMAHLKPCDAFGNDLPEPQDEITVESSA